MFEIIGKGISLEEFTISCWFCYPLSKNGSSSEYYDRLKYTEYHYHTLVQDAEGLGGLIVIDADGMFRYSNCHLCFKATYLGLFDDVTGELIVSPIELDELNRLPRGWHLLTLTVELSQDYPKG